MASVSRAWSTGVPSYVPHSDRARGPAVALLHLAGGRVKGIPDWSRNQPRNEFLRAFGFHRGGIAWPAFQTYEVVTRFISLRRHRVRHRLDHITGGHVYKSLLLSINALCASLVWAQSPSPQSKVSVHWEELTAAEFRDAIGRAQGTCLLPFGIMEKHGPHLPDRKSTRLNSSHSQISYAVFCLKKKKKTIITTSATTS